MPTTPTYSPIPHAPATARTQSVPTCRHARYAEINPLQPLKGLKATRPASVSYWALSPHGERQSSSFEALPGWGPVPTTPPPFRHTPCRFWPRQATTVWRNLQQNLHRLRIYYSSFCIHHSSLSHTFSAKERDSETGLSYFGSRYYSSDLSIWLSVDPMSDKYASLSPYVYCANNPVRLVDPNGEA